MERISSKTKKERKRRTPVLELRAVSKAYTHGDTLIPVLKPTSLCIYKGDYLSIRGPSGSGKSTLMHLMGLLDTPTSGRILLSDRDVSMSSEKELARIRNQEIGFVFQQFNLLPKTVAWEQVALPLVYAGVPADKRKIQAIQALQEVGLEQWIDHFPSQLSGGQQQRVAIARALVTDPTIIFADEPTGNLDSQSGSVILDLFGRLNRQGRTFVVVTHETHVARRADRHLTIIDGMLSEVKGSKR